jgi:CubicO group peptidase (beta-lactamase class C family)
MARSGSRKHSAALIGVAASAVGVVAVVAGGSALMSGVIGPKGAGYHAKTLCSGVFVAGRDPADVLASDLGRFWYVQGAVDRAARTATASVFGFGLTTAVHRDGLGCTLARGVTPEQLRAAAPAVPPPRDTADLPWPTGDVGAEPTPLPHTDVDALYAAIDAAFAEPAGGPARRTRAVVVLQRGQLVAERYGEGFTADTPLLGWSMAKSVTAALIALAADDGLLDVSAPAGLPEWASPGDPRAEITIDQLLRMSSGLSFSEVYGAFGDATHMLFVAPSAADFAAQSALGAAPDTVWSYSSGTTNLLQRVLRRSVGEERYPSFPRRALFDRIGMRSAVIEPDASGDFVGSSFLYATARDWARFGLLHLQDGTWEGERVLPSGWVAYATTPTQAAPRGEYGAQWWLNAGAKGDPADRRWPSLPTDAYDASGFEGQNVLVVPSRDAVIVRLGLSPDREGWDFDAFAAAVLAALPDVPPAHARLDAEVAGEGPVDRAAYAHLGDAPWERGAPAIVRQDWDEVVADHPELVGDAREARWTGHPDGRRVVLRLERGVVVVEDPDRATLALLVALSDALDARVSTDQGRYWIADPQAPGGVREAP